MLLVGSHYKYNVGLGEVRFKFSMRYTQSLFNNQPVVLTFKVALKCFYLFTVAKISKVF